MTHRCHTFVLHRHTDAHTLIDVLFPYRGRACAHLTVIITFFYFISNAKTLNQPNYLYGKIVILSQRTTTNVNKAK